MQSLKAVAGGQVFLNPSPREVSFTLPTTLMECDVQKYNAENVKPTSATYLKMAHHQQDCVIVSTQLFSILKKRKKRRKNSVQSRESGVPSQTLFKPTVRFVATRKKL